MAVEGRILAHKGEFRLAEVKTDDAVRLAAAGDFLDLHANCLIDRAVVLRCSQNQAEALRSVRKQCSSMSKKATSSPPPRPANCYRNLTLPAPAISASIRMAAEAKAVTVGLVTRFCEVAGASTSCALFLPSVMRVLTATDEVAMAEDRLMNKADVGARSFETRRPTSDSCWRRGRPTSGLLAAYLLSVTGESPRNRFRKPERSSSRLGAVPLLNETDIYLNRQKRLPRHRVKVPLPKLCDGAVQFSQVSTRSSGS